MIFITHYILVNNSKDGLPNIADKWNIISFENDSPDLLASTSLLHVDFLGLIEDGVHVLIKADDLSLDAQVRIFKQPDLYAWLSLEELVDQELYMQGDET